MQTDSVPSPDIWLLLADKLGDNAQAQLLIDTTGLPYTLETECCRAQNGCSASPAPGQRSGEFFDPERSDRLEPPWPDLVLTVGRRPTMAALRVEEL